MADLIYDSSWNAGGTGVRNTHTEPVAYPRWLALLLIVAGAVTALTILALLVAPFFATSKLVSALFCLLAAGLATLAFVTARAARFGQGR